MNELFNVMAKFQIEGNLLSVEPYGSGHINVTYLAVTDKKRYILQKINNNLFTAVDKLMNNIYLVTEHLKHKCPEKTVLTLVKTIEDNKDVLLKVLSIDRGTPRPRKDITYMSEVLDLYNYVFPNFKPEFNFDLGVVNKENLIDFLKDYSDSYVESVDNQMWFADLKQKSLMHNFVDNKTYKVNPEQYAGSVSDTSKFVRIAITGGENSPELYSIMKILGEKECKTRINNLINWLM